MSFGRNRGGSRGFAASWGLEPLRQPFGFRGVRTAMPTLRSPSMWRRALAKDSKLRHMDWVLVLVVLALSLIGTLLVWSATAPGLAHTCPGRPVPAAAAATGPARRRRSARS